MPEMEQPINTTTANTSNWDKVGEEFAFDETAAPNLENPDQAVIQEDAMATGAEAAEAAMAAADLANSVPMPTDDIEETQFDKVAATNLEGLEQAEGIQPITNADVPITETITNETTTVETPAPETNTAPTAIPQPETPAQPENPQPQAIDQTPNQALPGDAIS